MAGKKDVTKALMLAKRKADGGTAGPDMPADPVQQMAALKNGDIKVAEIPGVNWARGDQRIQQWRDAGYHVRPHKSGITFVGASPEDVDEHLALTGREPSPSSLRGVSKAEGGAAKDARKALMLAHRIAKADGGSLFKTDYGDTDEPKFYSMAHRVLSSPDTMGGMKQATPVKWADALQKEGVGGEEMNWLGVKEGDPSTKVSREDMLGRVASNIPNITEKIHGGGETSLENVNLSVPPVNEWDIDYDEGSLRESAREGLNYYINDNIHDHNWLKDNFDLDDHYDDLRNDHLGGASQSARVDPDQEYHPNNLRNFIRSVSDKGWVDSNYADQMMSKVGNIGEDEWVKFSDAVTKGALANYGKKKEALPSLPGFETDAPKKRSALDDINDFEQTLKNLSGDASGASSERDIRSGLNDKLSDSYYEQEREMYENDPNSPRSTRVSTTINTAQGPVKRSYNLMKDYDGDITVNYDPGQYHENDEHLGSVDSVTEAKNLILSHLAKLHGLPSTSGSKKGEIPYTGGLVHSKEDAYNLPGLANHREIEIRHEPQENKQHLRAGVAGRVFTPVHLPRGHYGGALAHARIGDLYDDQGRKFLHIDELQSDPHQQINYYNTKEDVGRLKRDDDRYQTLHDLIKSDGGKGLSTEQKANIAKEFNNYQTGYFKKRHSTDEPQDMTNEAWEVMFNKWGGVQNLKQDRGDTTIYPNVPLKESSDWGRMLMRRIMHHAAQNGYDGVSLSPGWVQYDRWDANRGHVPLYDKTFRDTMTKEAKTQGLPTEDVSFEALRNFAKKGRIGNYYEGASADDVRQARGFDLDPGKARAILFPNNESREAFVKKGTKFFRKYGGMVRVRKAGGGAVNEKTGRPTTVFTFKGKEHVFDVTPESRNPTSKSLASEVSNALRQHLSMPLPLQIANQKKATEKLLPFVGKGDQGQLKPFLTMNAKLEKAGSGYEAGKTYEGQGALALPEGIGVETWGMAMSPAHQHNKFKLCPNSAACRDDCLGVTSGNLAQASWWPRQNSKNRTHAFLSEPGALAVQLHNEIQAKKYLAAQNGNKLAVRLNVLSDIDPRVWESLIKAHPDVDFYDYTKMNYDPVAPNHHYTYSSTGVSQPASHSGLSYDVNNPNQNWKQMRSRLDTGSNVAMVFSHKEHLPKSVLDTETGKTYSVVDGTTHDYRPLDRQPEGADGVIVGLKNLSKNLGHSNAAKDSKGFVVHYEPALQKEVNPVTGKATGRLARLPSPGMNEEGSPIPGDTIPTNDIVRIAPQAREGRASGGKVSDNYELPPEAAIQQFHNLEHFTATDTPPLAKGEDPDRYEYGGVVEGDIPAKRHYQAGGAAPKLIIRNTGEAKEQSLINSRHPNPAVVKAGGGLAQNPMVSHALRVSYRYAPNAVRGLKGR